MIEETPSQPVEEFQKALVYHARGEKIKFTLYLDCISSSTRIGDIYPDILECLEDVDEQWEDLNPKPVPKDVLIQNKKKVFYSAKQPLNHLE